MDYVCYLLFIFSESVINNKILIRQYIIKNVNKCIYLHLFTLTNYMKHYLLNTLNEKNQYIILQFSAGTRKSKHNFFCKIKLLNSESPDR